MDFDWVATLEDKIGRMVTLRTIEEGHRSGRITGVNYHVMNMQAEGKKVRKVGYPIGIELNKDPLDIVELRRISYWRVE